VIPEVDQSLEASMPKNDDLEREEPKPVEPIQEEDAEYAPADLI